MKENRNKVISFPSRVPAKADYQRVKSNYTIGNQAAFWSQRTHHSTLNEQGNIQATQSTETGEYNFDFQALTQFRRVRELRSQG